MAREKLIQVRVTADELARIDRRAKLAGVDRSVYLRELGLGERRVGSSIEVEKEEHPASDPTDPRLESEIAEARMDDDAAREAFLERRTRELVGKGNTTPVARRKAAEEWAKR